MDPQLIISLVQTGGLLPIVGIFLLKILPAMNDRMASSIDKLSDKIAANTLEISCLRENAPALCQYVRLGQHHGPS